MVQGVCDLLKTECALSVSGIAGPAGATPGKEVGLVYIGLKIDDMVRSFRCQFNGTRDQVRRTTVKTALLHLLNNLK
jgi:nicotinamide-nucleotide amidase